MQFNYFSNPTIPQQQVVEVNGKASIDNIRLAPNSSILVMDKTAPLVWLCISDSFGNTKATPYDIKVHEEEQPADIKTIESRLADIEMFIKEIKDGKSDDTKDGVKPDGAINSTNQTNAQYGTNGIQSTSLVITDGQQQPTG